MTTYHFIAQALTPVHIGSGCEIDPNEFLLKDDMLIRFSPSQVIENLTAGEKQRFSAFLDRADLKEIQNFLRHHLDPETHGTAFIDTAEGFRKEYSAKAANPNNQFRVEMMPRNPHTGAVFIPGSSIKGAIRTAMVNYFANLDPATRPMVHQQVAAAEPRKKGDILEEKAFGYSRRQVHGDFFRLLHVNDATLPPKSTRVDRALNSGAEGIQMWVERLKSKIDQQNPPAFKVSLRLDAMAMNHPAVKNHLGRTMDIDLIFEACNRFYWGRMTAEGDRFDERQANGASWQFIEKAFPLGRLEDGGIISINPSVPFWSDKAYVNRRMLIRVGHFSHFESLSVDELRKGWNMKKREPITGMGSTRTRCVMENGKHPMPFGWLMLTLDQETGIEKY